MTPDTVLQLGDFAFSRWEVPERIPLPGEQMLAIQKLQGGARVIDAMGADEGAISWSGRFQGADALERVRYLVGLRKAGKSLQLTWSEFSYTVLIHAFVPDYERFYQIPYSITCEVVADNSSPVTSPPDPSIDDAMGDDMGDASDMGGDIGDDTLTGQLDTLSSALASVSDLYNAGMAALASITDPLGAALGQVGALIATAETVAAGASTMGGVVTGVLAPQNAVFLTVQTDNADKLCRLYELQAVLNRMGANLSGIGTSGTTITVAGANLWREAAVRFGDPSQWTAIAKANDLTDPLISGVQDILIPAKPDNADGVLSRA